MGNKKILLVGCGEIGSRHLQSVATMREVGLVEVVDGRAEGLEFGRKRLAELGSDQNKKIEYRWMTSLKDATAKPDLVIVATQAKGRGMLTETIATQLQARCFILEKLVEQSNEKLNRLLDFCERSKLNVWVNCKARAYPFHQRFKKKIDNTGPIYFTVQCGNHGLATSGVHIVDLFCFYDDCSSLTTVMDQIDPVAHVFKRGEYDLSGSVVLKSEKGSMLTLHYAKDHKNFPIYEMTSKNFRFLYDHPYPDVSRRWAFESDVTNDWKWEKTALEGHFNISEMTRCFAADIFQKGTCLLPTLKEVAPAHHWVLAELTPHFSRIIGKTLTECPIT